MDTQIYHSTLSDRRFASFYTITTESKTKWTILLASMVFHLVLPGILYSYGIILVMRIGDGLVSWGDILTPSFFFITWTMAGPSDFILIGFWKICSRKLIKDNRADARHSAATDPLFRDAHESWGSNIDIRMLCAAGVILTFIGVVIAAISTLPLLDPIYIGIFGGLGTSLTLTQIDFVLSDVFETNLGRIKCFCKIGQAFGQCVMPYFMLPILEFYGNRIGLLVVSCIIIQILPIVYFIKSDRVTHPPKVRKYVSSYARTHSLFDENFSDPNYSDISSSNNIQLIELSQKTWRSPSDENIPNNFDSVYEDVTAVEEYIITEPDTTDNRQTNFFGVEILPRIVEEIEVTSDSETDEKIFNQYHSSEAASGKVASSGRRRLSEDIKRLSVISDNLDIIIRSSDNIDDIQDGAGQNNWVNYGNNLSRRTQNKWFSIQRCCSCSSYKMYRLKRYAHNIIDGFVECAVDPFLLSIATWQFYPALLLKVCSISIPYIAPCLVSLLIKDLSPQKTFHEIAFITTVHGTSWLCVLIALPCLLNRMAKSKFRYISAFGMFATSIGLFAVMHATKIEFIALSTALIGIGYGLISTTCEDSLRDSIGILKWTKLRGSIDFAAGVCLLIIAWLIGYKLTTKNNIDYCFGFLACLLFFSGLYLIVFPLAASLRKYQATDHHLPHFNES